MRQIDDENKVYGCNTNETVTMIFSAINTPFRITFQFNGDQAQQTAQSSEITFSVPAGVTKLEVFFHFINESDTGGSYQINLRGSAGGSFADQPPVRQAGDLVPSRMYTFNA